MALVPVYFNNFDSTTNPLNGASSQTSGTNVGVLDIDAPTWTGKQYVLFSGINENAKLEANVEPDLGTKYSELNIGVTVDFYDDNGPWVNGESDGITLNYGDPTSLSSSYEEGVTEGLAVKLSPIQDTMAIIWNGVELSSVTIPNLSSYPATTFGVHVYPDGTVKVVFAGYGTTTDPDYSLTAKIPNNEWATTDQSGWDVLFAGRTGLNGGTGFIDNVGIEAEIVCFAQDTLIQTPSGATKIQDLKIGDLVATHSSGPQEILWIGKRHFDQSELQKNPNLFPVKIGKGSLGRNIPDADLWVSRQHRMIMSSKIIEKMFDVKQVFAPAITMTDMDGVDVDTSVEGVTYYHFMCKNHEIISANGALSETLYFGEQTKKALPEKSIDEIYSIFPELLSVKNLPTPAAILSDNRQARQAVRRHIKNLKPAQSVD